MTSTVTEDGLARAIERLAGIQARARNLTPVWRRVGALIAQSEKSQYATEGFAQTGRPWAPLSPEYATQKIRDGYGDSIEVRTGEVRAGLTSRPMGIERYYPDHAEFGVPGRVAMWQQYGTRNRDGSVRMPARPLIVMSPRLRGNINRAIAKYVVTGRP